MPPTSTYLQWLPIRLKKKSNIKVWPQCNVARNGIVAPCGMQRCFQRFWSRFPFYLCNVACNDFSVSTPWNKPCYRSRNLSDYQPIMFYSRREPADHQSNCEKNGGEPAYFPWLGNVACNIAKGDHTKLTQLRATLHAMLLRVAAPEVYKRSPIGDSLSQENNCAVFCWKLVFTLNLVLKRLQKKAYLKFLGLLNYIQL